MRRRRRLPSSSAPPIGSPRLLQTLTDEILYDGLDDWVPLGSIWVFAGLLAPEMARDERLGVVRECIDRLIDGGLAEPGPVEHDGWHLLAGPRDEWREIIAGLLENAGGSDENWEYAIWLRLTPEGEEAASTKESVLPDPLGDPDPPDAG